MTKAELKQKFRAGQYPTENDFAELIDMILTPTAEIPQKNIIGLLSALQGKYNKERGESLEASIENLVNNLNAEIIRAKQVESEKANRVDIINSLFKGTLYLNNNSDAIYKDAALTDIDNQHDADSAGIWIIRGNSVVGIMSRGWNEATIYPHNARYLIHWVWSEERGQWVRSEIAKSYTITEAERNKWNNVITNLSTETTRAQNAESSLRREIDVLKVGSIDTMQEGAQVVTDTTNGKYGLLLTSRAGSIDNWRQRLITFTGIIERRWDRTIGNMGGNWSPIWTTILEWDKITTEGADISNETLTLTGGNMVEDTTAIILQTATVYNNTLIL